MALNIKEFIDFLYSSPVDSEVMFTLTGASDLASPFFTPRMFLDGISILLYTLFSSYIVK